MATLSNAVCVLRCNAVVDKLDTGSAQATGKMVIYSGTPPARPDASLSSNTVLATHLLANPAFGAAADVPASNWAAAVANAIGDDINADATGTATFARLFDRDDVPHVQCTVSATGGGGELQFNTAAFVANALVTITAFEYREAEG